MLLAITGTGDYYSSGNDLNMFAKIPEVSYCALKETIPQEVYAPPTIIFAKIFHQASVQRVRLFSTLVKTSLNYSNCKFENLTSNPKTINLKIGHLFKALYSTGI